jgi:hypothetical protein
VIVELLGRQQQQQGHQQLQQQQLQLQPPGNLASCQLCGLTFPNNRLLVHHLATHEKLVCHICGKKFIR